MRIGLCQAPLRRLRRTPGLAMEEFLADPRVKPLPALGPCSVAACVRRAESEHGMYPTRYVRWRSAISRDPAVDQRRWCLTASAVAEGGYVSLRGLPDLVVVETLFGLQQRIRGGAKVNEVNLRAVADTLRLQQASVGHAVQRRPGPQRQACPRARAGPAPRYPPGAVRPRQPNRPKTTGTWASSAIPGG